MYEDNLYLSNLYEYLEQPVPDTIDGEPPAAGPTRPTGCASSTCRFTYPGAERARDSRRVDLTLRPARAWPSSARTARARPP